MKSPLSERLSFWFTAISVVIGVLFVIVVSWLDIYLQGLEYTFSNIIYQQETNKLFWVVNFFPLPLVVFSYILGKRIERNEKKLRESVEKEQWKTTKIFNFVEQLREGGVNAEFLIEEKNDRLGQALISLRDELKSSKEEEQARKKEDEQRHWVTQGIALFGNILRENSDNLEALSFNVISELVRYIDAKQGGFFVLNDQNPKEKYFELTAHYAYGRKKFADKKILWGEGLVGACGLEKETIVLPEVTENYVEVTSGLGKANPKSIIVVPLKFEGEVHGVIELASFKVYDDYVVEFIEQIAQNAASTISSLKINLRTAQLLKESQEKGQILAQTEKEMRANMEELKRTQIEAAQQAEEFISFTNSVNHTMIRAEYSVDGKLLYANSKFLSKLGYESQKEVEGKNIEMFINQKDQVWFKQLWENLAKGGSHFEGDMKHVTKNGADLWTMATYVSVRNQDGTPRKILFLGIDTTDAKKQSLDYKGQIDALNRSTLKAEYEPDGRIIEYNERFLDLLGYQLTEIKDKMLFDYISGAELEHFRQVWATVLDGQPHEGHMKRLTKKGEEVWLHGTYTVVEDMYGDVAKVVYIASDITAQRQMEDENAQKTLILEEQEKQLMQSKVELSKKLRETREEVKNQFREVETIKMLNEMTLEGMLDGIFTVDEHDKVTFFNKAAEELWDISAEKIIDKDLDNLLPKSYDKHSENYLGRILREDRASLINNRTEVTIVDSHDQLKSVLVTLSEARIGQRMVHTAFIQNIELELF